MIHSSVYPWYDENSESPRSMNTKGEADHERKNLKEFYMEETITPNQWPKEIWKEDMAYFKDARINSATMPAPIPWCIRNTQGALAGKLAQRYGNNPHIVCWHVNNEYGGECYCENCEKAFRVWLRKKYKTLEALNEAWNMEFWGHTIYDWEEIVLPNALSEGLGEEKTAFAGISIDYRRFNSDSILENYKMERDAIRRYDKDTPITTNLMEIYKGLDYFKWAKEMDIVSWDNYPRYNAPWSYTALCHDLMRGLKGEPFMTVERCVSQQNWQKYNALKRPGQMRAQSYQTMAHGADTILFFQLRRSVGASEKFHGAVIAHSGTTNTRVFREVSQLGAELEKLGDKTLGSVNQAQVGLIFDWDNFWSLEYTSGPTEDLKYVDHIHQYYKYFYDRNMGVDIVPWDGDFSKYKILAAPVLYMVKEGMKEALEAYVAQGGILITTYMSGLVGQSDNVYLGGYPGPLREMAGVWVEEIDALAPEQKNQVLFADGTKADCGLLCDLMHLEGAQSLGTYEKDFYKGMPAVTRNTYGKGAVYYVGTRLEEKGLYKVMDMAAEEGKVTSLSTEPTGLEITCRKGENSSFYFLINFKDQSEKIPEDFVGDTDLLTGKVIEPGEIMEKYQVRLVEKA